MNDPGYDFFALGGPTDPATDPPPPPAAEPPILLSPVPPVVGATYHSPAPARTFQMGNMTVNQFGTPVELPAVPTGPYAAPGMGAAPAPVPGLVTTWQGPQASGRQAPAGRRTGAGLRDELPRNVRAVAILALFFGVLASISTFLDFSRYGELKALVDAAAASNPVGATLANEVLSVLLVVLVLMVLVSALLLVGGGATLAHKRWGGWMLVASFGLYLLGALWQMVHDGFDGISVLVVGIAVALLGALVTGDGRRWLMDES
jgi:hypothetical protein